ncbi:DedA family protein [Aneurinibacillus sp. REN35]|uniref:DedA family protein n=1 Tax=Aneurinibacillus sp. REN35 TaxID=3237286 RepID=UPI00352792F5
MTELILAFVEILKGLSYFGLMLALTFEFVPAELVLPLAGYWVYQGEMNYWLAVLAGTIGGTLGPLTLYAVGRYGGRPFILRYGKYLFIREQQVEKADRFFHKYGPGVAFFARFLPGVRTLISIPCGMAKMNVWQFSVYTFAATLPITAVYVYAGYAFGPHYKQAAAAVQEYSPFIIGGVLLLLIGYVLVINRRAAYNLER